MQYTKLYTDGAYSIGDLYFLDFYYSLLTMVGNDLLPQNDIEIGFSTLFILIGSIVIGTIIGEFSSILSEISKKARQ